MRVIKLISAVVLCIVCFLNASGSEVRSETVTLQLASDVWPPYTDAEGKPRHAIALVEEALKRGQMASRTSLREWSEVIDSLKGGRIDGCAAMWRSPDREEYMLFSKPYLENRLVLVGRKGAHVNLSNLEVLKGKRILLVKDYAYGDFVERAKGMVPVYGVSDAENLRTLLSGEVDYMLADELLVQRLFDKYPEKAGQLLVAGTKPMVKRSLHFALRKNYPGAGNIVAEFDRHIERMRGDGTYNRLLDLSWIRTDVDGDGVDDYVSESETAAGTPDDPRKAQSGYHLFRPVEPAGSSSGNPLYVIDGKPYRSWDEVSSTLKTSPGKSTSPPRRDEAGIVLFQF